MRKKYLICLVAVCILFLGIAIGSFCNYILYPVSVENVKSRLSYDSEWKDNIIEVKIDNLDKMGVQLFCAFDQYPQAYFLVNHFSDICLMDGSTIRGDLICQDYNGDGEYELLYMSQHAPASFTTPYLYVYKVKDGKIQLISVTHFKGQPGHEWKLISKDGELFIQNECYPEYDMYVKYENGAWKVEGERAEEIEIYDNTEYYQTESKESKWRLKDF